jgi:hypothetical protein
MLSLINQLQVCLEDTGGLYTNACGVLFDAWGDDRYVISARHPGGAAHQQAGELRIFLDGPTVAELIQLFALDAPDALERISPADVLAAFDIYPFAHVLCLLPESRGVEFRIEAGRLVADDFDTQEPLAGAEKLCLADPQALLQFCEQHHAK